MKHILLKLVFGLFVYVLINNYLYAQSYFDIDNCTILGSKGEPIAYAAVELINTPVATISDNNGKFSLKKLPFSYKNDTLRFSHLAYADALVALKEILNGENLIYMREHNNILDEITVKPNNIISDINALRLLKLAIEKITDNYSDSIYTKMGKFRFLSVSEITNDCIVFSEGINNILLPSIIHNTQKFPNQDIRIDTLYDVRKDFLCSVIDSNFNYRSLIPFFCDYRVIEYYLNYGIVGDAFPLANTNINSYNYNIRDTISIANSDYVRITLRPKKYLPFSFHGELSINTKNYHIKNIDLKLVRHTLNLYHQKSIIIGAQNMDISMPIYDLNIEIDFTEKNINQKSFLNKINIETAFNVVATSLNIDTERIKTIYEISDFAPYITNTDKLRKKNPTRMQKRLIKKINKAMEDL